MNTVQALAASGKTLVTSGRSPRGALNNAGWNAFATVWNIGISFLATPLLIGYLGTSEYGLLLLAWSVTGVLGITNLGVGEATLRYVSHYLGDGDMRGVNRVFRSTLAFYVLICTIVSFLLLSATPTVVTWIQMSPEARETAGWLLRLCALLFSIEMISNAFRSIPMALQRYDISSKIGFCHGTVRTIGFVVLVVSGFGILHVIVWDVFVACVGLSLQVVIARKLLPGLQWLPGLSLHGLREIFGYGVYSFLTGVFLSVYRESGKFVLGSYAGPAGVAYLGTPDSVVYRLYVIVISGVETLMPRFSANRDPKAAKALLVKATEVALTMSVVLLIPLAVLMPDVLRLWINAEFASESGEVGQLLAISFIAPAAFAPIAAFYRGTGRPGFVTAVLALAGIAVLLSSLWLVPQVGAVGVGYGYLLSAVAWLGGLLWGWIKLFGTRPATPLLRAVGVPLVVAIIMFGIQRTVRSSFHEVNWVALIALGGTFSVFTSALFLAVGRVLGGEFLARQLTDWVATSSRFSAVRRYLYGGYVR